MAIIEERKGKDGSTTFRVKIRLKGHAPESQTFLRKTDAKLWAQQREAELRQERAFGITATAKYTVAQMIDRYIRIEVPKRRTEKRAVINFLTWWRNQIGDRALKDISSGILAECRDILLNEGHTDHKFQGKSASGRKKSPTTVVRYMAALSHAFSIAVNEWEWLETNPMSKVKKPSLPAGRVRFLDEAERERLLAACKASPCEYLYPVVVLALSTGARYSEIMNLRWRDIDTGRGLARLEETKNGERRALPITGVALEELKSLKHTAKPETGDFVFPRPDGLAPFDIRKYWQAALREAEVENFRFHDLRHTAASYLAMNGATLAEIAAVLGHKTLQMVQRYAHLSDQHVAGVVERMNKAIFREPANDNVAPSPRAKRARR